MKKTSIILILLLASPVYADEIIADFTEQSLPVLNDELSNIRDDLSSLSSEISSFSSSVTSKIGSFTRDMTTATGDVSYTGIGFKPKLLLCISHLDGGGVNGSIGFGNVDSQKNIFFFLSTPAMSGSGSGMIVLGSGTILQEGTLKTFDTDGFTLTWEKIGLPTGIGNISYLAFK